MYDEVRLGLGHGAQVRDVVPHDHIAQCEVSSRAEGQVADNEPHRCASMLMDNQQVGDTIGFAGSHQCPYLMPATVHALGTWEHQLQLLCKHLEAGTGVSGGRDHDLRVLDPCPSIFIIHVVGHTFTAGVIELQGTL